MHLAIVLTAASLIPAADLGGGDLRHDHGRDDGCTITSCRPVTIDGRTRTHCVYRCPTPTPRPTKKAPPKLACAKGMYLGAPGTCCPIGTWLSGTTCTSPKPSRPKIVCAPGHFVAGDAGCCPVGSRFDGTYCITPSRAKALTPNEWDVAIALVFAFFIGFVIWVAILGPDRAEPILARIFDRLTGDTTTASAADINRRAAVLDKEIRDFIEMQKRSAYRRGRDNF